MHYLITCVDKPDSAAIRKANRDAHLAYIDSIAPRILAAGPTLTEDGQGMTGSVLIIDFANRREAEDFCAADPYARAGLFQSVTIQPWRQVYPKAGV